jgi:hypothetical protein
VGQHTVWGCTQCGAAHSVAQGASVGLPWDLGMGLLSGSLHRAVAHPSVSSRGLRYLPTPVWAMYDVPRPACHVAAGSW